MKMNTRTGVSSKGEFGLWDYKGPDGNGQSREMTVDEMCDDPSMLEADKTLSGTCIKIKCARAFYILSAIAAFFAAIGNAIGIYQGNTLIDSAAGVLAGFSSFFCGLGFLMCYLIENVTVIDGIAKIGAMVGGILELAGAVCGCIGTCQEMHDMAKLAASLHIGAYKDPEKTKSRWEKANALRTVEEKEAQEMYANIKKRKDKEAAKAARDLESPPLSPGTEDGDKKKKAPVMLQRVLFRKPQEGDDDEIPTKMLEDAFAEIDGDGSGSIELEELVDALKLCGLAVSKTATDVVMKEIDKNADGTVDLREFIEFFRHIEDLNRFQKKTAARQQFVSFLLNFCFLADIIVVGVMLMMFIRMDKDEGSDNYSIMKNVLIACSALLGVLFLLVILMPILRLALGPTAGRMQKQYELAQEIKKQQRKKLQDNDDEDVASVGGGPRGAAGYSADDPPPPVNAAMFGRSYRPGKVESNAWTPAIEDVTLSSSKPVRTSSHGNEQDGRAPTHGSVSSGHHSGGAPAHGHGHGGGKGRAWRYDPSNYSIAAEHASMLEANGLGPTSWTPMQVKDMNIPQQTRPAQLPGAPMALTDAAFPQPPPGR